MENQRNRVVGLMLGGVLLLGAGSGQVCASAQPAGEPVPWFVQALETKPLSEVEELLEDELAKQPDDQQLWLALGTTRMLLGGEEVGQFLYRKGFRAPFPLLMFAPMIGMPVNENPNPEPVTMEELDAAIGSWIEAFDSADQALSHVEDPNVKLKLRVGLVHMDFDSDGELSSNESLWRIFAQMVRVRRITRESAQGFAIGFDGSDAAWMRGYAHVAMAAGEVALSLDYSEMFERTGTIDFSEGGDSV